MLHSIIKQRSLSLMVPPRALAFNTSLLWINMFIENESLSLSLLSVSALHCYVLQISTDIQPLTLSETLRNMGAILCISFFFFFLWCVMTNILMCLLILSLFCRSGEANGGQRACGLSINKELYWNVNKAGGYLLWILCFTCGTWNTLREYFPVTSHTTIKPGKKYEKHTFFCCYF